MRPVPAGTAIPATRPSRQRTSAFGRLTKLPEHRIVDSLLRSRAWIVLVAVLLGGIVAMQVSLLKLNAGISRAVEASSTLERQNADMQDTIARLSSGERVRSAAVRVGMIAPPAGDVGFLTSRPHDARLAATRMTPPSADARALMANGGRVPGALAAAAATTATTTTSTTPTAPAVTPTPTPPAATATTATPQG
jgi:hypothetical protein